MIIANWSQGISSLNEYFHLFLKAIRRRLLSCTPTFETVHGHRPWKCPLMAPHICIKIKRNASTVFSKLQTVSVIRCKKPYTIFRMKTVFAILAFCLVGALVSIFVFFVICTFLQILTFFISLKNFGSVL